jgi:STE24 endopeptidase
VTRRLAVGLSVAVLAAIWAISAYLLWQSKEPSLHLPHVNMSAFVSAAALHRADAYDRVAVLIAVAGILVELAVFTIYVWWGPGFVRESAAGPVGTGMLLGMIGVSLLWLAAVPVTVLELWWDRRHGLSHQSYLSAVLGGWAALGVKFVILCIALGIVMGFARLVGNWWWLAAAPVFVGIYALLAFVSPYLTPDAHKVQDPQLAALVSTLAKKEGVGHIPVWVENVSSQTSLPNAETEGFGPSRRIVIWNTLLDGRFSTGEINVVIAHELGHAKRDHIVKSIGWYALFAFPIVFLISVVTRRRGGMGEPAAVPLAILAYVVLGLVALPIQNVISRHREAEADWLALQTTHDPKDAKALFAQFVPTALADPNPPTWEYLLFEDHPTIAQRIAMIEAWQGYYATSASRSASGSAAQEPYSSA